jgi:CelD/BcsL family acetyltransferase involved in cellulose biosynthesis
VAPDDAFGAEAGVWRALGQGSDADTIFLTPEWMTCWWLAYGAGRTPAIVSVRRGTDAVALVPLQVVAERWKGLLDVRVLRFMGDGTYDSDYLDALVAPGEGPGLLDELRRWLCGPSGLRFDIARLNELPAASPRAEPLVALLESSGGILDRERIGCVLLPLPESWEAYVASLKPRMRTKVRSLRKSLEGAHDVRLLICDREEDLPARLDSLFDLHERRWATRGGTGVFRSDVKRSFYRLLSSRLLAQGWLRFHSLSVNGALVAHQYAMDYRGVRYSLQEGYDPHWEEQGVGNVLRAMAIEQAIGEGLKGYDMLAGVTDHKLSWGGAAKESLRLLVRGPGFRGRLVSLATRAASATAALRRRNASPR